MPRRGKLRLTRAKRGQWGCPENHDFLFCQLKTKIVNGNNFSQKRKSQFSFLPSICRRAYAERVNLCALYNKRALNNGAPENRNAQSGVRFLGKRSNKHTRTWRQATHAACPLSPCCDERKERKQAVSGEAACPRVFSEIKRIAASLLRDSREG